MLLTAAVRPVKLDPEPRWGMSDDQTGRYLGDGVTAVMEGDTVSLTAGSNVIFLEPAVFAALIDFVRSAVTLMGR